MVTFGYKRDPLVGTNPDGTEFDWVEKDKDFKLELLPKLTLTPGDVDLSGYTTESNQFGLSACAGNATGDGVEVLNDISEKDTAAVEGRDPKPPVQVSRLFIYSMARSLMDDDGDGQGDIGKDEGTFIRLCFEILSRFGVCDETVWPYDEAKVYTTPSIKALRQAVGHRIHSYYRIKDTGNADDRLDAMVSALRAKHPIVFGTLIDAAFQALNGPAVVMPPTGPTIGGHAMLCVGYVNGAFLVKNSWGKGWRDNGFVLLSPEYMKWASTTDLWVPTLGVKF
jgi:C1A family cysteine protease